MKVIWAVCFLSDKKSVKKLPTHLRWDTDNGKMSIPIMKSDLSSFIEQISDLISTASKILDDKIG